MRSFNVTVAIPLYRSESFADIVISNINRLLAHCTLLVSDCSEEDTLLQELKIVFKNDSRIQFLGKREIGGGWVNHWNDLMSKAQTPYFMWLSHDDEIEASWISQNVRNLSKNEHLAGSFGILEKVSGQNLIEEAGDRFPSLARNDKKFWANYLIENWNLGIAMRAVWVRSRLLPILHTHEPKDEWADIVWVYGILLDHHIEQITSVSYKKRWYTGSTHSSWRPFNLNLAQSLLLREIHRRGLAIEISEELQRVVNRNK